MFGVLPKPRHPGGQSEAEAEAEVCPDLQLCNALQRLSDRWSVQSEKSALCFLLYKYISIELSKD